MFGEAILGGFNNRLSINFKFILFTFTLDPKLMESYQYPNSD